MVAGTHCLGRRWVQPSATGSSYAIGIGFPAHKPTSGGGRYTNRSHRQLLPMPGCPKRSSVGTRPRICQLRSGQHLRAEGTAGKSIALSWNVSEEVRRLFLTLLGKILQDVGYPVNLRSTATKWPHCDYTFLVKIVKIPMTVTTKKHLLTRFTMFRSEQR